MLIRNSALVFVFCRRSTSSSMASGGFMSFKHAAQDGHPAMLLRVHQHLFLAGAAAVDVDRRPDAAIDQLAVEHDFLVAGPLELLENHFVHAAACVDQGGADHGQRAALFDFPRGAEEPLGARQGVGVDAAGEQLARRRTLRVPRPGQPRDRIEEDQHVAAVLDHPLGLLQHHFRHLDVPRGRLVERRTDHLAIGAFTSRSMSVTSSGRSSISSMKT